MKKETEYRRGAEDTMQAYVAFGKKQEAAIQHPANKLVLLARPYHRYRMMSMALLIMLLIAKSAGNWGFPRSGALLIWRKRTLIILWQPSCS